MPQWLWYGDIRHYCDVPRTHTTTTKTPLIVFLRFLVFFFFSICWQYWKINWNRVQSWHASSTWAIFTTRMPTRHATFAANNRASRSTTAIGLKSSLEVAHCIKKCVFWHRSVFIVSFYAMQTIIATRLGIQFFLNNKRSGKSCRRCRIECWWVFKSPEASHSCIFISSFFFVLKFFIDCSFVYVC